MVDRTLGGRPPSAEEDRLLREHDVVETGRATGFQLARMFGIDKNRIGRLLQDLTPAGRKKGFPLYNIAEAAAMLVPPGYEIEDRVRRMNQADLPPLLGKEFWNGQRSRKAFELESGDLWPTADVVAVLAAAFGECRNVLKLLEDNVDRQSSLTTTQREAIRVLTAAGIEQLRQALVQKFESMTPPIDNPAGPSPETEL